MYSLYRAWLSMSQQAVPTGIGTSGELLPLNLSAPAPPPLTNAPDVQLQVGPSLTNFSAHRNVLCAHSGFFKAALSNGSGPILVPNIQVDEFSSLLTFMYTGYLDLNLANIYNILLATHILHMPRALELCRNFLMQTQQPPPQQPQRTINTVIKPIATRKPLQFQFQVIDDEKKCIGVNSVGEENELSPFKKFTQPIKNKLETEPMASNNCAEASTSSKQPELSVKITNNKKQQRQEATTKAKSVNEVQETKKKKKIVVVATATSSTSTTVNNNQQEDRDRVIIDIACCDGPVRFHRVPNKNYRNMTSSASSTATSASDNGEVVVIKHKKRTEEALNKAMNENIKLSKPTTTTEITTTSTSTATTTMKDERESSDAFTCLYCNHTFKSQYCYQKHARRHLNPVDDVDIVKEKRVESATSGNKREFKLLDMNVQYYPCKTCGSKFPSYYFVHKHRKLCHADEMADGENKNNEIVQVKPSKMADGVKHAKKLKNDENSLTPRDADCELRLENDNDLDEEGSDIIDVEETASNDTN